MATARPRASAVKESTFQWEGRNKDGKTVRGEMRAATESVVQTTLRRQGITNTKVKKLRFKTGGKITDKDITLFTRQLATMMKSGVPLLQSFDIVGRGHANPAVGKLLLDIKADVRDVDLTGVSTYAAKFVGYGIDKGKLSLFVKYKIRPSFYTLHTYYFAEAHIKNRGKEQAMYMSPMRDAIDAGLRPTNHTDAVVAPLDQMFMLWSATNRVSRAGVEIGPEQRVTPLEGLKAMTLWAAEQYGEQASKGSLETGKLADLVILDKNPLKVDKMAIKDIKVLQTIKEGKSIYTAP